MGRCPSGHRLAVDFRPGVPDLTSFPLHDWLWAIGRAARRPVLCRRWGAPLIDGGAARLPG